MLNWDVLASYSFLVVAIGTVILAMAAGAVGCVTVLKGQSLIGDAIGHASFPGIVLAFMIFLQRDPAILMLGAIGAGIISFALIQVIKEYSKIELDAVLAVVLSSFFGLGMVLKSFIQGNPDYSGASQSGLQNYIFGQAAYMMSDDIKLILMVAIPSIILLFLFNKEIKVFIFDEVYAKTIGLNPLVLYTLMIVMVMGLIAAGLKIVGAILISSLLIVPAITALQWSDKFHIVLSIAAIVGGISAFIGTYISTVVAGMSTGPTIILVMTFFALVSLIIGPHGLIANLRMRREYHD